LKYKITERKQLTEKIENMANNLKAINKINELTLSSANANVLEILNIVVEDVSKIIKDIGIVILLLNDKDELFPITMSSDCKRLSLETGDVNFNSPEILKSLLNKKMVEIDRSDSKLRIQKGILFPILKGDVTIGAICVVDLNGNKKLRGEEEDFLRIFASQVSIILENKKHLETERAFKEEIMALNSIIEISLLSLTLDETLQMLITRIGSIFKADSGVILLKELLNEELKVRAKYGFKLEKKDESILSENNDIIKETFEKNNFVIKDKKISLPLKSDDKIIGCLILYKEEIDYNKVKFLENLIEKASIVIERRQNYESALNMINKLSSVSYLGNLILSTPNLEEVLNLIVKSVTEMLDAKGAVLKLLNEIKQQLEIYTSYGLSSHYLSNIENISKSIENEVIKSSQIKILAEGTNSLICVPLITKGKTIGILTVFFPYRRSFTEGDKKLLLIFSSHTAIAIQNAKLLKELKNMYIETMKSLATLLDAKDSYTRGHSEEVSKYAVEIAEELGLTEEEKELLQFSSILHDIGKIGVDDNILKKPSKLTPSEYEKIKKHPVIASRILKSVKGFENIAKIIAHHHEHYDGKGYPDGLKKDSIPLLSRIIAVADAFEAMTSDRPYRKAFDKNTALYELEINKNKQFDPVVVDAFKRILSKKGIV
jgi:putative nucleotidyltransferase with HDIG domain